jgi:hypothetical protein
LGSSIRLAWCRIDGMEVTKNLGLSFVQSKKFFCDLDWVQGLVVLVVICIVDLLMMDLHGV